MAHFEKQYQPPTIDLEYIPHQKSVAFPASSYFIKYGLALPSPCAVRERAIAGDSSSINPISPKSVYFPELNMVVKYGTVITIVEGQTLFMIQHALQGAVPVPEVYGWCRDGEQVFTYTELIHGDALESKWKTLTDLEKQLICGQFREIIRALRSLRQLPGREFVGPFDSVSAFHDWYSVFPIKRLALQPESSISEEEPPLELPDGPIARDGLPDDMPIVFTHSDLHRSNIIISRTANGTVNIAAIVGWHQSGWLPAYWEFCKATFAAPLNEDWRDHHLRLIFEPYDQYPPAWAYISLQCI